MKLEDLAREIGAELVGDGSIDVTSAATLDDAQAGQLSFLSNPKYASQVSTTKASAVVVAPNVKADGVVLLKAKDPYYAFRQAVVRLHGFPELEGFTAKSSGGTLQCGLQRPAGQPPTRVCTLGSDRVAALRAEASMFEVTLPADMLRTDSGSIELRWVDQYR